jgi:hypothetical protein
VHLEKSIYPTNIKIKMLKICIPQLTTWNKDHTHFVSKVFYWCYVIVVLHHTTYMGIHNLLNHVWVASRSSTSNNAWALIGHCICAEASGLLWQSSKKINLCTYFNRKITRLCARTLKHHVHLPCKEKIYFFNSWINLESCTWP